MALVLAEAGAGAADQSVTGPPVTATDPFVKTGLLRAVPVSVGEDEDEDEMLLFRLLRLDEPTDVEPDRDLPDLQLRASCPGSGK